MPLEDRAATMVLIMKSIFSVLFRIMKMIFLVGAVGHSSHLKNRYLGRIQESNCRHFFLSVLRHQLHRFLLPDGHCKHHEFQNIQKECLLCEFSLSLTTNSDSISNIYRRGRHKGRKFSFLCHLFCLILKLSRSNCLRRVGGCSVTNTFKGNSAVGNSDQQPTKTWF